MGRAFHRAGVVGLGTMGAGIAEVFARGGLEVVGVEPTQEALTRGRSHLERSTGRAVRRGRLDEAGQRDLLGRVRLTTDFSDLSDVDIVVEAVPERLDLKREVFARLDRECRPDTVLTTNTSSLSVTEIAMTTGRPDHVVGMHFFNPAPVLKLVEVVGTVRTMPGLVEEVAALATALGKRPVVVGDRAGFVANALLFRYLRAAVRMVETRVATAADVDTAMTVGVGLPLGPLALLDLIGLDTSLGVLESMYAESRDRLVAPPALLQQLVAAGRLGRKTGAGFSSYPADGTGAGELATAADPAGLAGAAGSAAAAPVRPLQRVAVFGSSIAADSLAAGCTAAGCDVVRLPADGRVDRLGDRDLVVVLAEERDQREVFAALDSACPPGTILADGSRFGSVAQHAGATGRPGDVLGVHLVDFPRADGAPGTGADGVASAGLTGAVVELAVTSATSAETVAAVRQLWERAGAQPVLCQDRPGRIVDALLFPYLNAAVTMVQEGYASPDDVDTAMRLGCGYPAGPVQMLDGVGLDVAERVLEHLSTRLSEPGLAPAPLLRELVALGRRGGTAAAGLRERPTPG